MGISPGLLSFGEWMPDISNLNTQASALMLNVVPRADGYGPFAALLAFTTALPGICRGGFFARNADGSITLFAATDTRIYKLDNTAFTWTDVSKGGVAYPQLSSSARWRFVQFNNKVITVQVNTVPQVYDLAAPATFTDLGGGPPQAGLIAIINRFVVLGGLLGLPYRVQWSGLNQTATWDNVTAQSNFQDLADGGRVIGLAGGDQFGVIFQDSAIRSQIFAPGSPVTFEILRIATNDGLISGDAAVSASDKIFFCSPQGFKVIAPGGYPTPIGREKVDRTFFDEFDGDNLEFLIAATDPTATRVYWAYKSTSGTVGQFDKILVYDYVLSRWTKANVSGQHLFSLAQPGLTLENLDSITTLVAISGVANNGSGAIRLTVTSTSGWTTGDKKIVSSVGGTTEANNFPESDPFWTVAWWTITVVDGTHIDLQGSTFTHAYTSGGTVSGSIDAMTTSFDTYPLAALVKLAAAGTDNTIGFFNGANLEAQLETPEQDGNGRRFFVSNVCPMTDCPTVGASVGARDTAQAATVYTTEVAVNDIGLCPVDGGGVDTRYAKVKVRMPAGSDWTYAMGIEPEFRMTGWR